MWFFRDLKSRTRGLTYVETLIVIGLFTLMMLVVTEAIVSFYRINAYTLAQAYQVHEARAGVELMVRDLREMTFADNGAFPLVTMENNRVGFFSDVDRDNSVEYVEYRLSSTTLIKSMYNATGTPLSYSTSTADASSTVSAYVQNIVQNIPMFAYYDANGVKATATTTATDIRYVQVNIIVNIDPVRDPGEYTLRSSAALRNLKNTDI